MNLRQTNWALDLLLLVVVSIALRAFLLTKESLWLDEVYSAQLASASLQKVLGADPDYPPLYYLILHFWVKLFGSGEAALRSLSIIGGTASVALTYLLGLRVFNRRVGLIAGIFMALSTFHIYYSQEARAYPFLLALILASTLCLHRILEPETKNSGWLAWLCYFFATVGALYTHFYAVFFVFAQNIFVVTRWRRYRSRLVVWVLVQTSILVVFSPWLFQMLHTAAEGGQVRRYLFLKPAQAIFTFLAGYTLIPLDEAAVNNIRGTLVDNWYLLVVTMLGFAFFFVYAIKGMRSRIGGIWLCGTMFVVPMAASFIVSLKLMIFDERYLIGVSPFLYLILATGAEEAFSRTTAAPKLLLSGARTIASILVGVVLFLSLYNYYFHPRFGREQWREVAPYVEHNLRDGDIVVFEPDYIASSYEYYAKIPVDKVRLTNAARDEASQTWSDIAKQLSGCRRIWFVRSHYTDDKLLRRFQRLFVQQSERTFPKGKGIHVYLLVNTPDKDFPS